MYKTIEAYVFYPTIQNNFFKLDCQTVTLGANVHLAFLVMDSIDFL
jgi:hypothetical protein